jgi:hypothetical protein
MPIGNQQIDILRSRPVSFYRIGFCKKPCTLFRATPYYLKGKIHDSENAKILGDMAYPALAGRLSFVHGCYFFRMAYLDANMGGTYFLFDYGACLGNPGGHDH